MRGFLKSREGIFQLASDTTTIGREGCDLLLTGDCADCVHAVIKYHSSDATFTLHDIGSMLGVYVNDCRVRNSAVQLEHNDLVRFGYTAVAYEFVVECQPKLSDYQGSEYAEQSPIETVAGDGAGWVAGVRKDLQVAAGDDDEDAAAAAVEDTVEGMRSQLACLRREVERMSELECECAQKDDLIQQLREEVTNLQNFVRHMELERCPSCQQLPSVCRPAAAAAGDTSSKPVTTSRVLVFKFLNKCVFMFYS